MPDLPLILEPAADDDAEPIERLNERVFGPAGSPAPPIASAKPRTPIPA